MKFAHTGDYCLTGFLICPGFKGRIFFGKLNKRHSHLFLIGFGLGLDSNVYNRLGEFHAFQNNRILFVAKRIAGSSIFKSYECANVAGINLLNFGTAICMHHKNTADSFFLSFGGVKNIRTAFERTAVATEERKLTYERIRHNLECKT